MTDHEKEVLKLKEKIAENEALILLLERQIALMQATRGWRMLERMRKLRNKVVPSGTMRRKAFLNPIHIVGMVRDKGFGELVREASAHLRYPFFSKRREADSQRAYQDWLDNNVITESVRRLMKSDLDQMSIKPVISVVMPVYNTPRVFLEEAVESVRSQIYENWELCVADDGSTPEVAQLVDTLAKRDKRIKVVHADKNRGIASATNMAFELVSGEWVAMLDHDDLLNESAFYYIVRAINEDPNIDIIYTDKDHVTEGGRRISPYFKPNWSPHTILSHNYIIHLLVFRATLIDTRPFLDSALDGSQDYDLILRLTEKTDRIVHIPKVLYSWRLHRGSNSMSPRDSAFRAGQKAIENALKRRSIAGNVQMAGEFGPYKVEYDIDDIPLVSIIISTCRVDLLDKCVKSVRDNTGYVRYEILVATNLIGHEDLREYCRSNDLPLFEIKDGFYSKMNNYAARQASGEYIVFLNDDTLVVTPGWIVELLRLCRLPEVGTVGPKLVLPDGRIQFTHMVLGIKRDGNPYFFDPFAHHGTRFFHGFSSEVISDVTAVSGACMMMRRGLFLENGGFDEETYNLSWQDMDLCMRLRGKGYAVLYTPYAELVHYGTETKKKMNALLSKDTILAGRFFDSYKADLLRGDPFFNPNLSDNLGLIEAPEFPGLGRIDVIDTHYDKSYWHSYGFPIYGRGMLVDRRDQLIDTYVQFASRVIEATGCARVVDIGCGPGLLVEAFTRLGTECTGIEASEAAVAMVPPGIKNRVVYADITSPPAVGKFGTNHPFCIAICIEVLEHIPKGLLLRALMNIKSLSNTIVISTSKHSAWNVDDKSHVSVMRRSAWIDYFDSCGLTEDKRLTNRIFGDDHKANEDTNMFALRAR